MVSSEEKKEIEKIKKSTNEIQNEEKIIPLVENINQFKISLPKKFTDYLKLDVDKHKAKVILNKKEKIMKIYIENV